MFDFLFEEELFDDDLLEAGCSPDEILGSEYVYNDYVYGPGTVCLNGEIHFADGSIEYL